MSVLKKIYNDSDLKNGFVIKPRIVVNGKESSFFDLCQDSAKKNSKYLEIKTLKELKLENLLEKSKKFNEQLFNIPSYKTFEDSEKKTREQQANVRIFSVNHIFNSDQYKVFEEKEEKSDDLEEDELVRLVFGDDYFDVFVKIGTIPPNSSFSFNTGIIINICASNMWGVKKNLVPNVLIPQITSSEEEIIPLVNIRDLHASGPIIISGTSISGKIGIVKAHFKSYRSYKITNQMTLTNNSNATVINPKHIDKRFKILPKPIVDNTKTIFDSNTNSISSPLLISSNQGELQCSFKKKQILLLTSRTREWFNDNLVSVGGYFDVNHQLVPTVSEGSVYSENLFDYTTIDGFIPINFRICRDVDHFEYWSAIGTCSGAMFYDENNNNIRKLIRKIISKIEKLDFVVRMYKFNNLESNLNFSLYDYLVFNDYCQFLTTKEVTDLISSIKLENPNLTNSEEIVNVIIEGKIDLLPKLRKTAISKIIFSDLMKLNDLIHNNNLICDELMEKEDKNEDFVFQEKKLEELKKEQSLVKRKMEEPSEKIDEKKSKEL